MWSVVPAGDETVICIEPIVGVPFQGILVILLVDPNCAAVGEGYCELERVIVNSQGSDSHHIFCQGRPYTGDSSL